MIHDYALLDYLIQRARTGGGVGFINFNDLVTNHNLTEEFIREFLTKFHMWSLCTYQTLSEEFIIEFKDKVDWYEIITHQKLSVKFIVENKERINVKWLKYNEHLTKEDKAKLKLMGII